MWDSAVPASHPTGPQERENFGCRYKMSSTSVRSFVAPFHDFADVAKYTEAFFRGLSAFTARERTEANADISSASFPVHTPKKNDGRNIQNDARATVKQDCEEKFFHDAPPFRRARKSSIVGNLERLVLSNCF